MLKRDLIIAAAIALTALPTAAQTTKKLTASKANEFGLAYSLPLTSLNVTVEAERNVRTRGEFYKYSRKYLNIDPILENETVWTLKSVTVNPAAVAADTEGEDDRRYLVQFKNGTQPFMMLTEESFPLSINSPGAPAKALQNAVPEPVKAAPTPLEVPAARQAVTEEMLQARSVAKKAELAAAKIYEIRQTRNDIISGQAEGMPSDGAAMKLALDNLDSQEAALTAMFTGTESKSTAVRTFAVIPERLETKGETETVTVARLSALDGIVDSTDLSGAPIELTVTAESIGQPPVNEKGQPKPFPKGGLAYCVPGKGQINVTYNGRSIFSDSFDLSQFGVIFGLEPGLFTDKKAPAYARFDASTGAIVELGTTSPAER